MQDLLAFLDSSPSPWHAAETAARLLRDGGFVEMAETQSWSPLPAAGFTRRGGALVAWRGADGTPAGVRIVGAHTDSPGLRIHPHPDQLVANWRLLGVEVYGGVLLNSWLDRDLGIAGRVVAADGTSTLVDVHEPIARVPQLAIHLDREVNERGLVLDRHIHLRPVWATGSAGDDGDFVAWLGERAGVAPAFWELCLYDVQPAVVLGADRSLLASGRLDNQVSCWAATAALLAADPGPHVAIAALFDHEEVGSESVSGASGPLLADVVERVLAGSGIDTVDDVRRAVASSSASRPTTPTRCTPTTRSVTNPGTPRWSTAARRSSSTPTSAMPPTPTTAALFRSCCDKAGVPVQTFVSRNNIPCGSTIGPLTATRLGIATVDVGVPQLSMHSARELCGAADPGHLVAALGAYWS